MINFPFKSLNRYRVKTTFTSIRSDDVFPAGMEVQYISSTTNVYECLEICLFREISSGKELIWHADEYDLRTYENVFDKIALQLS